MDIGFTRHIVQVHFTVLDPLRYGNFVFADPLNYMMIKATGQEVNR